MKDLHVTPIIGRRGRNSSTPNTKESRHGAREKAASLTKGRRSVRDAKSVSRSLMDTSDRTTADAGILPFFKRVGYLDKRNQFVRL